MPDVRRWQTKIPYQPPLLAPVAKNPIVLVPRDFIAD